MHARPPRKLLAVFRTKLLFASACLAAALTLAPESARAALVATGLTNGVSAEKIEEFRSNGIPDDQWAALMETLGNDDKVGAVRALIKEQKSFPAARLVALLSDSKLVVRLGALDLLEDSAGDTFGFDPWQEDPTAGENAQALERWKAWLEKDGGNAAPAPATLGEENFRSFASEIMSGDRDRSEHAMQRLEGFGVAAIPRIEAFLKSQAGLEGAARAGLKCAEYRIVLRQCLPKEAASLSRNLAFGAPQARSSALAAVSAGGSVALPVIADFLDSPEALVREAAVDAAFKAGEEKAEPLIIPRLGNEKAESVLHAMLRGLSTPAALPAIVQALDHPSENVVISALEALGKREKGSAPGQQATVSAALAARLSDPRWRVRAAALEAIGHLTERDLIKQVAERLDDEDRFVRVAAAEALKALDENSPDLLAAFTKHADLKAPILALLLENSKTPPPEVWDELKKAPPEIILQALASLESRHDEEGKQLVFATPFATHPNRDVAAMALRQLASHGLETGLLLGALESGDPVKQDAVLDQLQLPKNFLHAAGASADKGASTPLLDRLYDAVRSAAQKAPPAAQAPAAHGARTGPPAPPEKMQAVLTRFFHEGSPRQRFRAAVVLASQGDSEAASYLLSGIETLSSLDRRYVAGALGILDDWPAGPILELAQRLLRDPADDVREKATEMWLNYNRPSRLAGLLAEFERPGSLLHADDLYSWELDRTAQSPDARSTILNWARPVLENAAAPVAHQVLAIILLGRSGQARDAQLDRFLESSNPWLRRAAYRALGAEEAKAHVAAILRDESAMIRVVLPFLASPESGWMHWFDDSHSASDHEDLGGDRSYGEERLGAWSRKPAAGTQKGAEVTEALEKLANDPSDLVRFEARFALLRLGHPVDPVALAGLVAAQPSDSEARDQLGRFLSQNFHSLGKAYGVLVPVASEINKSENPEIISHFGLEEKAAAVTFEELARIAPAEVKVSADNAITPAAAIKAPLELFRVVFFYKPGCRDCEKVREMLNRHAPELPRMVLEEHDMSQARAALLNETLSARFKLKDTLHQVTPAVFTQAGALVRDEITYPRLGDLLRQASTRVVDTAWLQTETADFNAAQETIVGRYNALSVGIVALAGLLDGINPCAFATIIFLLSYLQIARRTPREILAVGSAFVLGVFLAYFVIGLGLAEILARISALRIAGLVLNYALAASAFVIALLSFRDARLAAAGDLGDMALKLPVGIRDRIHGTIRIGARATRFVVAAFAVGIVVSFLELACTGQVYLPTIQYMLRAGRGSAVGHLGIYNLAFIVPLLIVFALSWAGMRSEALVRFQKSHIASVKVLMGLLFLLLAAFLIFGNALIPHAPIGKW